MGYRTDIQGLRGIAVLFVLLYHAKLGFLSGGYLGVDIFFVISGYLITKIVKEQNESGVFSFSGFYSRRAKRLLPAAYATFFLSSIFSFLLGAEELRLFVQQLIGAVTFTSNIFLWQQGGYFGGAGDLKPLLHIWSLSLEEQYYFILPLVMYLVPRRYWFGALVSLFLFSLIFCIYLTPIKSGASFYLLPTRAWELAVGSLTVFLYQKQSVQLVKYVRFIYWPAVLVVLLLPLFPLGKIYPYSFGAAHPGIDAILVCLSTAIIILGNNARLNESVFTKKLGWVGDFSYSLYLAHWPVFAYFNVVYIGEAPIEFRVVAIGFALVLGYALYRFVENPARRSNFKISLKFVASAAAFSILLVSIPLFTTYLRSSAVDYKYVRRPNVGFGIQCVFDGKFTAKKECQSKTTPKVMVWGDSFAMHLVPGVLATSTVGVLQATRYVCGPFLGVAPMKNEHFNRPWAESCVAFNQSVFDYLKVTSSIEYVILASPFTQYVQKYEGGQITQILALKNGQFFDYEPSVDKAVLAMQETIKQLQGIGKKVIVIAPPPSSDFDVGRCLERKESGLFQYANHGASCEISVSDYRKKNADVIEFVDKLTANTSATVIRLDEVLCSASSCITAEDGKFIYRDKGHLSYDGSVVVAKKLDLRKILND